MKTFDPYKVYENDEISLYVLIKWMEILNRPPKLLLRKSVEKRWAPKEWWRTNLVPISKKGNKQSALNYSPVSLTNVVFKLLVMIIRKQILQNWGPYPQALFLCQPARFWSCRIISHKRCILVFTWFNPWK